MSLAFEITPDDIIRVAQTQGVELDDTTAFDWLDAIDARAVEKAALYGHDLDQQIEYADQEILDQLRDAGLIVPKFAASGVDVSPKNPKP